MGCENYLELEEIFYPYEWDDILLPILNNLEWGDLMISTYKNMFYSKNKNDALYLLDERLNIILNIKEVLLCFLENDEPIINYKKDFIQKIRDIFIFPSKEISSDVFKSLDLMQVLFWIDWLWEKVLEDEKCIKDYEINTFFNSKANYLWKLLSTPDTLFSFFMTVRDFIYREDSMILQKNTNESMESIINKYYIILTELEKFYKHKNTVLNNLIKEKINNYNILLKYENF